MRALVLCCILPVICFAQAGWQQDVQYTIDASLNPSSHTVHGSERLVYRNNSPDVLTIAYFHLYWNLFTPESYGIVQARSVKDYFADTTGGITVESFRIRTPVGMVTPDYTIDNTIMKVTLPTACNPGDSIVFVCVFTGKVPEGGVRTGHRGRDYNIAQWYPQIAVYDRYGWDQSQYLGPAEFHCEYGTFDVNITVPRSFTLGHSGALLNPGEVLSDSVRANLQRAAADTGTVRIADYSRTEWGAADTANVTWKFHAANVRDFAWSADEHYIWDAACCTPVPGGDRVTVSSLYFPDKARYWAKAAEYGRHTIMFASRHFGPYVYPNVFVVEGVVGGGMEYPGITFIGHYGDEENHSPFGVISHEVGHNWYPMMIGSNETAFAFMDEGFTTYLTARITEDYFGRYGNAYSWTSWYQKLLAFPNDDERARIQRSYFSLARSGYEEPVATHTYRFTEPGHSGTSIYSKTGAVLYMLQYVLGDSVFEHAMQEYYRKWRFRHPYPEDFYAAIEEASGRRNLRWFWDEWFNKTSTCDYGISGFRSDRSAHAGSYSTTVAVHRYRPAIMPVDVKIRMSDGKDTTVFFPIDLWLNDESERELTFDLPNEGVSAELNPDGRILDINRLNNTWPLPRATLRFDNTLFNVPPLDAYLVRWRPSVWYTDQGGWNFGGKITGSYLDDIARGTLWGAYNTRDHTVDADLALTTSLWTLTPKCMAGVRAYTMEGRRGFGAGIWKAFREHDSYPPYHTVRLRYSYTEAFNTDYLLHPSTWQNGVLQRMLARYEYSNRGEVWNLNASAEFEGTAPVLGRSDFQYSKRTFEVRTFVDMPGSWRLALRLYDGEGTGDIPAQTAFYFGGSSPVEQLDDPLLRSKGVLPSEVRDHAAEPGGGLFRALAGAPLSVGKLNAINAEARFNSIFPFTDLRIPGLAYVTDHFQTILFMDAVRGAAAGEKLWDRRLEIDCGVGLRLSSIYGLIGTAAESDLLPEIGLNGLRVDFPFYTSIPQGDDNKLKFRWAVSFRESF